jgi:hypothetical protein
MEGAFIGGAFGGIIGAVLTIRTVARLNAKLRELSCPGCGEPLSNSKLGPQTFKQLMWGGLTCRSCGCEVDRHGKEPGR